MENLAFDPPIVIDLDGGPYHAVGSVGEALALLKERWPRGKRGEPYAGATRACLDAIEGQQSASAARDAFALAAWEAGVFVTDISLSAEAGA